MMRGGGDLYYYVKLLPPTDEDTTKQQQQWMLTSHAVHGTLFGKGMVERFDIYQRILKQDIASCSTSSSNDHLKHRQHRQQQQQQEREIIAVDIKMGNKLNGHEGIVHGGIISLLFDEAIGCACECLRLSQDNLLLLPAMTAYLNIDYHSPLPAGTDAVLRVYHNSNDIDIGRRKMNFVAKLESNNDRNNNSDESRIIVYAEARSLFILMKSNL